MVQGIRQPYPALLRHLDYFNLVLVAVDHGLIFGGAGHIGADRRLVLNIGRDFGRHLGVGVVVEARATQEDIRLRLLHEIGNLV